MKQHVRFLLAFSCLLSAFAIEIKAQNPDIPIIDAGSISLDDLLWNLDELSTPPDVKWLDQGGTVQSLLYTSVDYKGNRTEVFAWYSNPDLIMGRPSSGKKFPGVVLVHGGGGKAFKEWVERWAADGYAAVAMDLSGNGPDGEKVVNPGPEQSSYNKFGSIENGNLKDVWSYHAVASVILAHSFLSHIPKKCI